MSLYNAVAQGLAAPERTGPVTDAVRGALDRHLPAQARRAVSTGLDVAGDLMDGNWESAGRRLFDSGLLDSLVPGMGGLAAQTRYWGTPTPLFGGISPSEAKRIYEEFRNVELAKKNLFLIEVSSRLYGDFSRRFNLFTTEVDYAPLILSGEKRRVGAANVDAVQSSEAVELRITTLDDKEGSIKTWYAAHHAAAAARDGTVGVPGLYAIRFRIVHAFITQGSNQNGYEDIGWFRPANLETALSRREDGLEEVQMTFSQVDTFMRG